jgi:hypothetical protein
MSRDDDKPDDPDDDDTTPTPATRPAPRWFHAHSCEQGCGTTLTCEDDDRCRVREPWTCPSCEDRIEELQLTELAKRLGKD